MIRIAYMRLLVVYLSLTSALTCAALIDLTEHCQDFILQVKQIHIPGFPGAFNASVIRWKNSLLMCFRVRDAQMISTFQIGCLWLDEEFNPVNSPHILQIRDSDSLFTQNQDPRLIVVQNKLYILYSNFTKIGDMITRRMFIAQMQEDNGAFFIEKPICLDPFPGGSKRWEKNWTPFDYHGSLFLTYSQYPHIIFKPDLETGYCQRIVSTRCDIDWSWGELRGGTPAVLDESKYISFFHSSKEIPTVHSAGKKMQHYVMGAYRFSSEPPFEITHISPEPIVAPDFYNAPEYNTWKPLRVVFPMGLIVDEQYLWVTYGRQDFEIWVAQFDKKRLYESLIACECTDIEQGELMAEIKEEEVSECENMYDIS